MTAEFAQSGQESRSEGKQLVTGHPVLLILGAAAPKAAIEKCLRNLY